jgi:hypothetical protein
MKINDFWSPYYGAVSLSFDDGTKNQLEKAIPPMNDQNIRGTFYICPNGEEWHECIPKWKDAAAFGHEIGNHTLSHFCPCNITSNFPGLSGSLEDKTLHEIEQDILKAQELLFPIAPHQKHWTFCYPCNGTYVGKGLERKSYVPIIAKNFLAGRVAGEYGFANHPHSVDLSYIWGLSMERMSGYEMIGLVEELTSKGLWVILVFHEIDGSRLTVGSYDFNMLLQYLKRKRDQILIAPIAEIAEKIAAYQSANKLI